MKVQSTYLLKIFPDSDALNKATAEFIITIANKAVNEKGRFVISLSGGKTPENLYSILSKSPFREKIPWQKTDVYWGDERCVPLNDERNNAHRAKTLLLEKVDIPVANIHPVPVNLAPETAAKEYENEIKNYFLPEISRFDLIILGLGENGHTASLFPDTKILEEQTEGVRDVYVKEEDMFRVTMTAPLINQAHHILFLVSGEQKAEILEKVLSSSGQTIKYPAQLIRPSHGDVTWFVDQAAATSLNEKGE
ncbi:MAG: 6-phosphogluconolactonase [Bacteroidota bacterium]